MKRNEFYRKGIFSSHLIRISLSQGSTETFGDLFLTLCCFLLVSSVRVHVFHTSDEDQTAQSSAYSVEDQLLHCSAGRH